MYYAPSISHQVYSTPSVLHQVLFQQALCSKRHVPSTMHHASGTKRPVPSIICSSILYKASHTKNPAPSTIQQESCSKHHTPSIKYHVSSIKGCAQNSMLQAYYTKHYIPAGRCVQLSGRCVQLGRGVCSLSEGLFSLAGVCSESLASPGACSSSSRGSTVTTPPHHCPHPVPPLHMSATNSTIVSTNSCLMRSLSY